MKNSLNNETSIVTQEYNLKDIGNITLTTSSELLMDINPELTNKQKLSQIRRLLKEAYDHYFYYSDGHCKINEGFISIEFGDYWSDPKCECQIKRVCICSYVFGPHRTYYYDSLDEALEEVAKWHKEEMSMTYEVDIDL